MRSTLRRLHRYASLALAGLWLLQAATGMLMVFHWEIDDAQVPGAHRPVSPAGLGAAVLREQARHPASRVTAFYATAGAPDRFDIHLEDAIGRTDIVRIDGAGQALIERPLDHDYARAGLLQAAVVLHQTLFAGDAGKTVVGCSALLLITNIAMGLVLGWPAGSSWRRVLVPTRSPRLALTLYTWHRAVGLWLSMPALVLASAGAMLAFEDPVESLLGTDVQPPALEAAKVSPPSSPHDSPRDARIAPAIALQRAVDRFPMATLASLRMPADGAPWYRVRLRQPGEAARVYGTTAVYVDAQDARIIAIDDPLLQGANRRFVDALFPTHTGEIAGTAGRCLAFAVGLWLLSQTLLGISLWWTRRPSRSASLPRP
ncbi:MAG: PepSY-associated TM helix domain-containing protein [Steroidobacteraceae bacterium]